jgi:hypothetical protein
VPVGLYGFTEVFPSLGRGKRARETINVGKPYGPFAAAGSGLERREQLDEISHEIMRRIAELLPQRLRGYYSNDPVLRATAKGTEIYPWADKIKGEVQGEVH